MERDLKLRIRSDMIASLKQIAPAEIAAHYDELDTFYRDIWGDHVHHGLWIRGGESRDEAMQQMVELIAREGGIQRGSTVCDIGCGYGATARVLAKRWGARVTAITISPAQHAFAQTVTEDGEEAPEYVLGDWLTYDVPVEAFDAAIACESSEHMPDKAMFFEQAARGLKPGGKLVVSGWLAAEDASEFRRRFLLEPICREGHMASLGSEADYRRLGEAAGFACERLQDVSRQAATTWPQIALTFLGKLVRNPRYARFLVDRHARNRVFALTAFRLWVAFRIGALRYGVFTFVKPMVSQPGR